MGMFQNLAQQEKKNKTSDDSNQNQVGMFQRIAAQERENNGTTQSGGQTSGRRTNRETGEADARSQRLSSAQKQKELDNATTALSEAKTRRDTAEKNYTMFGQPYYQEYQDAKAAVKDAQKAYEDAGGEPSLGSRLKNILTGGTKQSVAGNTDAMGVAYQAGQEQRNQQNQDNIELSRKAWEQQQRTLDDMLEEGGWSDQEIESQRAAVEWTRKIYESYAGAEGIQQQAGEASRDTAVQIAQSGEKDLDKAKQGLGTLGQMAVDAGASTVQMGLDIGANAVLGANPNAMLPFASRAFGGGTMTARANGADLGQQVRYGGAMAAKEVLTEKMFSAALPFAKAYGGGSLDGVVESAISKAVDRFAGTEAGKKVLGGILSYGAGAIGEGLEELIGDWMEWQMPSIYGGDVATAEETLQNSLYDFLVGAMAGGIGVDQLFTYDVSGQNRSGSGVELTEADREVFGTQGQKVLDTVMRSAAAEGSGTAEGYAAFSRAYTQGVQGKELSETGLSRQAAELAYYAGKEDGETQRKTEKFAQANSREAGLVLDNYVRENLDLSEVQTLNETAKALGVRVQFTDSMENGAQGKYEKGTVLIAKDAPDPLKQVYGHEITHRMQELAPTEYAALRSAVQAELGGELEYQVQSRIQLYGRHDVTLSYEEALDEVTADYAGELIRDGQVLEDFIQRNRENRTLLEKLRDAIRDLISKLTGKDRQQVRTAEERLSAALDAAAKQAEKNTAREGGGKYSITSPDHVGVVALLHENIHNLKEMDPLSKVDGTEVQKAGRTTERVLQYLDSIGGKVVRPGFGEVIFSRGKIKSSFVGHGIGDAKIDLIAGVPSVIENGKQISFEKNWKNRSYDSYTFAGPVEYKGEIVYLAVIVTKDGRNGNRYYLHEAVDQDGNIIYGNEKKTGAASDRPAQKVRDTIAVSDLDSNIISGPDGKSNGKFSVSSRDMIPEEIKEIQRIGRKSVNELTSGELKKLEPFASRYWTGVKEKSPFFRAWFGDWRANDQTPVTVVMADQSAEFSGGKAINTDTAWTISWGDNIKRETRIHGKPSEYSMLRNIREIVRNAVLLDTNISEPSSKSKMPGTVLMHSFYSVIDDGTDVGIYKLFVEEAVSLKSGEPFTRSYELKEIAKVANPRKGVLSGNSGGLTHAGTATEINVADLFRFVKANDAAFHPRAASKIVDEDGRPLVVYHGTDSDFTVFDSTKSRSRMDIQGSFFSPWEDDAMGYGGKVGAYYLNIKNPADERTAYRALRRFQGQNEPGKKVREYLISLGYDGVDNNGEEYIAFYPEQIKSATENTGAFDRSNPDIRYSMPGTTQLDLEVKRILAERGDKTDDEVRMEINQAVDRVYQGYVETYGAMQPGEKPAREVQVPKKTGENEKVSQTVRTILEAKATPEETLPDIQRLVAQGDFSYEAYTDKQALADAEHTITGKGWQQSYADWRAEVRQGKVSKENTATGWVLYNNAVNEGNTALAMDILQDMVRHQRSAAQAVQATRILKKLSPESQLYNAQRSVQNLQEELKEKYGKKAPELKISEQLAADFLNAETEEARDAAMEALYKDIGRQMPSNWMDKWTAWRYVAMLGNPRTHIRNIVGNAGFMPVVKAKNAVAAAAETAVDKLSGGKAFAGERGGRSKALGRDKRLQEAARADYDRVVDQIMAGGKYQDFAQDNAIEAGRVIFKFKPLEKFRTANGAALELEDAWFARKHYTAALASYCRANGITEEQVRAGKGIDQARAYAIREAQKATYRDANDFSQMVSDLGRYSGDNQKKKVLSTLVEGVLPFRKTPANILARGVEYSPLGLVKSLTYDLARVAQGKKTTAEMLDGFASGLTGTGLLALGFFLAGEGLIRGAGAGDDDEKKFSDLTGHQDYALEAWGYSVTLDWLAPEALPFFVGVNLQEQLAGKADGETLTMADYLEAIQKISAPLLEMSCLQSLNNLFEYGGYAKEYGLYAPVSSAATSYLTQALPTLFGQIERMTEEKRMTTYTEKDKWLTGDVQYALGRASTRFPLDYDQIPYIDAWGREETTGGVLYRAVNNFLNPAYVSKINESSMEQELQRLYDATGDAGVFPKRPKKTITVNKKDVDLTGEEYVKLATIQGQTAYALVGTIVESDAYKAMDDTDKAKYIEDAYDYAMAYGKCQVSDYTPSGDLSWVAKAMKTTEKTGMDPAVYIYARLKTKGVESLKDSDGDSIPNSLGLQTMEAVYAIPGLKEEQRKALFSDFGVGKSVIHYNKAAVAEALGKMRG